MVDKGNALSRNPNICASCSSLADGMDEANEDLLNGRGSRTSRPGHNAAEVRATSKAIH